jgi:ubiquitin-conjugating enzyme E2 M
LAEASRSPFAVHHLHTQIYHPNLDLDGNICLNILREEWKPVLNLSSVMVGLQYLFLEPNPDDPLNKGEYPGELAGVNGLAEAAEDMRRNQAAFEKNVKTAMRGGTVGGVTFDSVLVK